MNKLEHARLHENALAASFVVKNKQERVRMLLESTKNRRKFTSSLAHYSDFDPRYVIEVPNNQQSVPGIARLLLEKGAIEACYLLSEDRSLDKQEMLLREALDAVVGSGMGTLISCVPGKLVYYEGESKNSRLILARS